MANLISAALKAEVSAAMTNVFDTFARENPVTFYKVAAQEILVLDSNYNADFMENTTLSGVDYTTQSQSFTCRIIYEQRQEYSSFIEGGEDTGTKSKFYYNRVKLQCKEDAFLYLQESERFELAGEKYQIEEAWRRIGLLGVFQFYQVVLKRVN